MKKTIGIFIVVAVFLVLLHYDVPLDMIVFFLFLAVTSANTVVTNPYFRNKKQQP